MKAQEEKLDNFFKEQRDRSETRRKSLKEKYEEDQRNNAEKFEKMKLSIDRIRKERSRLNSRSESTERHVSFRDPPSVSEFGSSPPAGHP